MRRTITVSILATLAFLGLWVGSAVGAVVNGGFETGDLTGWTAVTTTDGDVTVETSAQGESAIEGTYFALLEAGDADTPVTLSQTIVAAAGDEIRGQAFFSDGEDGCGPAAGLFEDHARVRILQGASEVAVPFSAHSCATGTTPWTAWSYTVLSAGSYTIEASVTNDDDGANDSYLGLDAVEPSEDLADLTITKVCLTGDGDGDADFNVRVYGTDGADVVTVLSADALDCGEVMVVAGLAPGLYTISELITGPDANNFVTAIICTTAAGDIVTPGSQAQVSIGDTSVRCSILNAFQDPGAVAGEAPLPPCNCAPTVIVPVTITNTNNNDGTVITTNSSGGVIVNTNTNSGGQVLDNQNVEHNDNINDNTQRQTTHREQTNDSSQD